MQVTDLQYASEVHFGGTVVNNRQRQRFVGKYGPWVVVTGASSGIGRAFATELAALGLNVFLVARNKNQLDQLASSLQGQGVQTEVFAADLGQEDELQAFHAAAGKLDVGLLVASAGFGTSGPFSDNDRDLELSMIDVNCRALAASTHYFSQVLKNRDGGGGIILLSSIVAFQGNANSANYSATKAYVQSLAEGLHAELKPFEVDVLAVAPGPTDSGFASRAKMQMGATLTPETVAQKSLLALGRRATVLPGFLSKLLKYVMFGMPRWCRTMIMSKVMNGMAKPKTN
ncbi:MAG: SDR family NAD(P)-dependent oxidoreductase [Planctomycetota bacterium]